MFSGVKLDNNLGELQTASNSFNGFLVFAINLVYTAGIGISILFVIIGGIKMITSNGDPQKMSEGRNTVMYAIIGFVVIIGFRVILTVIFNVLGLQSIEKFLQDTK